MEGDRRGPLGLKSGAIAKVAKKTQRPKQASTQSIPKQTDSSMGGSIPKAEPATAPPGKGADDASAKRAREWQQQKEMIVAAASKAGSKSLDDAFKKGMTKHLHSISALEKKLDVFNPTEVERDLHDSVNDLAEDVHFDMCPYEKTIKKLRVYMKECLEIVETAVDVVLEHGVAFDWCNQVLMTIADTWDNINAIPSMDDAEDFQLNPYEEAGTLYLKTEYLFETVMTEAGDLTKSENVHFEVPDIGKLLKHAWPILLVCAADPNLETAISDGQLLQMCKDAVDNGVNPLSEIEPNEYYTEGPLYIRFFKRGKRGYNRIKKLYHGMKTVSGGSSSAAYPPYRQWGRVDPAVAAWSSALSSLPSSKREPKGFYQDHSGHFPAWTCRESSADSDDESF